MLTYSKEPVYVLDMYKGEFHPDDRPTETIRYYKAEVQQGRNSPVIMSVTPECYGLCETDFGTDSDGKPQIVGHACEFEVFINRRGNARISTLKAVD